MEMKKCVFFDRDGIVNVSPGPGYVERWADFRLSPEFPAVLDVVQKRGYAAVIVTNQRGVFRGILTMEALDEIHANLQKLLADLGCGQLLDIMVCPHDEGVCECRKPRPGMLLEAARRHGIDLAASWMVGDNAKDVEAGRRAGCRTIFVGADKPGVQADHVVPDMKSLEPLLKRVLAESRE